MNGGLVLIGNAPTALFETIMMIKEGVTKPALVIGMPVGFVSAPESKEELSKTEIPFITNRGRKGGSAVASSIMNALMLLLQKSKERDKVEHQNPRCS
jgi:precorrin-8X/cobalt-precorrin-8 methylmutase